MEKSLSLIAILLFYFSSFSQENFHWEKIDSINKTKDQLYSDTKLFIANTWKYAQNVIQNDDKDGGIIVVKGASILTRNYSMVEYTYIYHYTVTFMIKDNKYRIIISDVINSDAYPEPQAKYDILKIQPFDGDIYEHESTGLGLRYNTLPNKKAVDMMNELRSILQTIFELYLTDIQKASVANGDW